MNVSALLRIFVAMGNLVNAALSAWIFYSISVAGGIALIEGNQTIALVELALSAVLLIINVAIALIVIFRHP